jgi:hypothetical protein
MFARWTSFGLGVWLMLAPLVLGYHAVGPILVDVATGLLVCILTLAALEWPPSRFVLAAPGLWLVAAGERGADRAAAAAEIATGMLLVVLAAVPSAPLLRRAPRGERGRERVRA